MEPAPEDVDGLAHYFLQNYQSGSDEDLLAGMANAHAALNASQLEEVQDGFLTDLSREELNLLGMGEEVDPTVPTGMYLANVLPCTLSQVEELIIALNQDELYPGSYTSYHREYTSDEQQYRNREVFTLTWTVDIEGTQVGQPFTEKLVGGARYVPAMEIEDVESGPLLLARTVMTEPAVFDDEAYFFTQDYQFEVYWERAPGETVHFYPLWRHMGLGTADTDDESIVRLILNGLADWDEDTASLCQEE